MNKQRYVVTLGAAASLAALLAGCSKSSEKATTTTSTATKVTTSIAAVTDTEVPFGSYKEITPISSTSVNGIEFSHKTGLVKYLEAYADYGYQNGVLGDPKDNAKPTTFGDGSFLQFKGKNNDHSFHAITLKKGAPKAYAVWGAIGDNWHGTHSIPSKQTIWGYPIGIENQDTTPQGDQSIVQKFEKGTVTFSKGKVTFTPNKHK